MATQKLQETEHVSKDDGALASRHGGEERVHETLESNSSSLFWCHY